MVEQAINSIFDMVGQVTGALRGFVSGVSADYVTVILLGIALAGGYYLEKKYPNLIGGQVWVLWGIIFFLLLKFV